MLSPQRRTKLTAFHPVLFSGNKEDACLKDGWGCISYICLQLCSVLGTGHLEILFYFLLKQKISSYSLPSVAKQGSYYKVLVSIYLKTERPGALTSFNPVLSGS